MTLAHRLPPLKWRKESGLLLTSAAQRKACFDRDHGKCNKCGVTHVNEIYYAGSLDSIRCVDFHADHIVALHAIPPSIPFPEALKYWRIDNLQTLCRSDHRTKSAIEVHANAKVKRIRRRLDGTRRPRAKIKSRPFPKGKRKLQSRPFQQPIRRTA
jgi:5-methylcytosine-specific restriction endonuclease McrA